MHNFEERFGTEKQCLDYLFGLRWPDGYYCPRCNHNEAWRIKEWKYKCRKCGYQATVLAGTVFQDTHLPIPLWFKAIWYVCSQKGGTSALDLQKVLCLGSYRTAWTMLLRIRKLMADNAPNKLSGRVTVDIYSVHRSDRAKTVKLMIAVELQQNNTIGNLCMDIVPDSYYEMRAAFIEKHIKKGSLLVTDTHSSLQSRLIKDYTFGKMPLQKYGKQRLFPPICAVVKYLEGRKLFATQQLSSSTERMQSYLDECCYKFNKRKMTTARMFEEILYSAVHADPIKYRDFFDEK